MELKPGLKLKSAGSSAEFIVIKGMGPAELTIAGARLDAEGLGEATPEGAEGEVVIGKRYSDAEGGIELLCTRGGPGPLRINGETVEAGQAKALPSSD